jgi:pSer/pThr/pTyr-binding forkhead associated (FHA) protein
MSELALTLLRLGFLALLWIAVFLVLSFMRRDLRSAERRTSTSRREAVTATSPDKSRSVKLRKLIVTTADDEIMTYPLVDNLTIGRGSDNIVVLDDDYASTNHAVINLTNSGWLFSDLGSTNGTWLDRKRLESPLKLKSGITIRIGRTALRFEK